MCFKYDILQIPFEKFVMPKLKSELHKYITTQSAGKSWVITENFKINVKIMMNRFYLIEKEQILRLFILWIVERCNIYVYLYFIRSTTWLLCIWPRIEATINMFDQNFQVLFHFTPTIQKKKLIITKLSLADFLLTFFAFCYNALKLLHWEHYYSINTKLYF